jgi:hypothetical protein
MDIPPPSIVFERPADKLIEVETLDPPAGYNAPAQGHAYVEDADRWNADD